MTSGGDDVGRLRRRRSRVALIAARERWLGKLSYEIRVTWPGGVLGWLCGATLLLAPVWLLLLTTWTMTLLRHHEPEEPGDGEER